MEYFIERLAGRAGNIVRHWWILLIAGLLLIAGGIVVFCNPVESYLTLSVMFGILMLVTGVAELVVAITSHNFFAMRGYSVAGGIIDLLIGIFLCCYPGISIVVLPIILGVYLLYHSFMIIGFGSDLKAFRVNGSGYAIAGGVILLILAILILLNPFRFGTSAVVILTGVSFLVMGCTFIAKSLRMRDIHKFFKKAGK
ncbi:MAG: DUF308 domain-containing protein [Bacteroidales bacterium]|nr:DUF308 domain-containing protein [Bacteroides sp.]MCM1197817.1 DUF308 domain-containing protein [Clostridium sp.]MCM1501285.1 DUF308 domain-containing protein [Bacteroidales bacterium]